MEDQNLYERIRFRGEPLAAAEATVTDGNARFTVLTARLIRMEWSENGTFEDHSTFAFPNRRGAAPVFETRHEDGWLVIDTGALTLRYQSHSGAFTAQNLSIALEIDGLPVVWKPGAAPKGNLLGTLRTLDECEADAALDLGLASRDGWSVYDDSRNPIFSPEGWVTARPEGKRQDWYFFGYGRDYVAAIQEYRQFGGATPLIPRFVLGGWWSRYWAYSEQELRDLVAEFEAHNTPLDVLVIDMDWHTPDAWTGYTWNRQLFPNPPEFLNWVHQKGLRATLNLHPAQGVQHFEAIYPEFAEAMGMDPASGAPVEFKIANPRFVENYFKRLHHPLEDQGVDFWWMDWQQGESSEVKGLDPLTWINHLHFKDSTRKGARPMLYSRWGGLGNHRYYIGFSGDTVALWRSLQFQPYMTATAANVLFGWWSHDIGGHMGLATEPELYARWVQFGALSPCLRLHSTKDIRTERRPWAFPEPVYQAARAAFQLRYRLIPTLYSLARESSDTGVALAHPMYYADAEAEGAYAARYQYKLGNDLIAAPIVFPADEQTGLAPADVWLPEGEWIDCFTLETYAGPGWTRILGDLNRVPLLIRAGGLLPLADGFEPAEGVGLSAGTSDRLRKDSLRLDVFPGPEGEFRLYEDDGTTDAYLNGEREWTRLSSQMPDESTWIVTIDAVEGRCPALPAEREWKVTLRGANAPESVRVNDEPAAWEFDAETSSVTVILPKMDKAIARRIHAVWNGPAAAIGAEWNERLALADATAGLKRPVADLGEALAAAAQAAPDLLARLGGPGARFVEFSTPEEAANQWGRAIFIGPESGEWSLKGEFVFHAGLTPQRYQVEKHGLVGDLILDTPFAWDGAVRACRWSAEFEVRWEGGVQRFAHRSIPAFISAPRWQAAVLPEEHATRGFDDDGAPRPALPWKVYEQDTHRIKNLTSGYHLDFAPAVYERFQGEELKGRAFRGYAGLRVESPEERDVVILYQSQHPVTFQVNGEAVKGEAVLQADPGFPFEAKPYYGPLMKTAVIHLREGVNLIGAEVKLADADRLWHWLFGMALATPAGEWMTDLEY